MRSTKTLLIILRDHLKEQRCMKWNGLCVEMADLSDNSKSLVTHEEFIKVTDYFKKHRPKRGKFFDREYKDNSYFWEQYKYEIRFEWLNHLIELKK